MFKTFCCSWASVGVLGVDSDDVLVEKKRVFGIMIGFGMFLCSDLVQCVGDNYNGIRVVVVRY